MRLYREFRIFKKNRSIAYTGMPKVTDAAMPQKLAYDIPIYAGRFVFLKPVGLLQNKYMFADFIVSKANGFYPYENDSTHIEPYLVKYLGAIVFTGDDHKYFRQYNLSNVFITVMLLEVNEMFGVPYNSEYFKQALEPGDPVALDAGYYRKAKPGEGIIGYFVGNPGDTANLAFIKFYPEVYKPLDESVIDTSALETS